MGNNVYAAMATPFGVLFVIIAAIFGILLCVLWFLLPFAVFGTKPKLDELKQELVRVNENLQLLIGELRQKESSDDGDRQAPKIRATRD